MTLTALAEAVIEHATEHYEDGGWDVVVECLTVEEIIALWVRHAEESPVGQNPLPTTVEEAVASFETPVSVWADRQADARNSAF